MWRSCILDGVIRESLSGVRGAGHLDRDLADENLAVGKDIPDRRASEGRDRGYGRHGMIKGESSRRGARSQGQVQVGSQRPRRRTWVWLLGR